MLAVVDTTCQTNVMTVLEKLLVGHRTSSTFLRMLSDVCPVQGDIMCKQIPYMIVWMYLTKGGQKLLLSTQMQDKVSSIVFVLRCSIGGGEVDNMM
jgi:hypothetical protein